VLAPGVLICGCAQQPQVVRRRLPVPPLTEQIHAINHMARRINTLRLTGTLTIHYFNRHNQPGSISLHAVLLLHRTAPPGDGSAGSRRRTEALLLTTYLGQNALELGVNQSGYWLINHQKNIAYLGALNARGQIPPGVLPLNPARLPALLGFTTLPTDGLTLRTVVPGAPDLKLLVLRDTQGRLVVSRQIVVSRYSGRIRQVTLFDAHSRAQAVCDLSHYPAVAPAAIQSAATPVGQLICRRFTIAVPQRRIRIEFNVHHVYGKLPAKAKFIFRRPSLRGDKIRVIGSQAAEGATGVVTP
jgi:hypothetical protein